MHYTRINRGTRKVQCGIKGLALVFSAFTMLWADVTLNPGSATRDAAWVVEGWTLGCYIIHAAPELNQIKSGTNVTRKMKWVFTGASGKYQVKATVLSHFSCADKCYVKVGSATALSGTIPKPNTGYCCAPPGSGCRTTAKDNLSTMTGSTVQINTGDVIEYGGTTCVCFDQNKMAHGAYCGIHHLTLVGSGGGGTVPVCGNGKCESGETCSSCERDCGKCPVVVAPVVKLSSSAVSMSYKIGDAQLPKVTVAITNGGTGMLPGLTCAASVDWLVATITGSGNSQTLTVALAEKARNAVPKEYTASIAVNGSGVTSKTVSLKLTVTGAPTAIGQNVMESRLFSPAQVYYLYDVKGSRVASFLEGANLSNLRSTMNLGQGILLIVNSKGNTVGSVQCGLIR